MHKKSSTQKADIIKKRKLNNRIFRKPVFLKMFLVRFLIIMIISTVVFGGIVFARRYCYKDWLVAERLQSNYSDYSYQSYIENTLQNMERNAYKSDKAIKKYFKVENIDHDKLFSNLMKSYTITRLDNTYTDHAHLYTLYNDMYVDLFESDLNSLIFTRTVETKKGNLQLAYELKDENVSKQLDRVIKKLNRINMISNVTFEVKDVYIRDKDMTFITDKIYVQYIVCGDVEPSYDSCIETNLPSEEELKKQGYIHINLEENKKSSIINTIFLSFFSKNTNVSKGNRWTTINMSDTYYIKSILFDNTKNYTNASYEYVYDIGYRYLIERPMDGKSIWLKLRYPAPGGRINYSGMYNDFHFNNGDILKINAMCLYTVALLLSVGISFITFQKRKTIYEINTYRREMTNVLAHDLKTPLMVLRGNAENLTDIIGSDSEDIKTKGKKYADNIIVNVDYMNDLVNKTLNLTKLEEGTIGLDIKSVSILSILEKTQIYYSEFLSVRGIKVCIEGDDITVAADEFWLTECFKNIFDNAAKYADDNSEIKIILKKNNIRFENSASGLTEEDMKEINDPFAKTDKSRSGRTGSGLGLSIVKNIIELHKWNINTSLVDGKFVIDIKM
ncbi:MAG: HAMP domain-containing histidine kinase [Butyrivibrio sp.]|nr:HAMP domain-containing histidine kinase [Butyrivibrio sp.]